MQVLHFSPQDIQQIAIEAQRLNDKISFPDYLSKSGYTSFSPRLFMKEDPLELIRIYKVKGQTHFRNFENKNDRGRLMDFIRNRSIEEGKVIPNKKIQTFLLAIECAKKFLQGSIQERITPKRIKNNKEIECSERTQRQKR